MHLLVQIPTFMRLLYLGLFIFNTPFSPSLHTPLSTPLFLVSLKGLVDVCRTYDVIMGSPKNTDKLVMGINISPATRSDQSFTDDNH